MARPAGRLYDVFVPGTHEKIAVFGPESPKTKIFCGKTGVRSAHILPINNAADLMKITNEIPLILFPLWWKEGVSPEVISAARSTNRQILTAFPM